MAFKGVLAVTRVLQVRRRPLHRRGEKTGAF